MKPFFTYYGGKWRIADKYGAPTFDTVVEPFCGSAGYSVRHNAPKAILADKSEPVCSTWAYLIRASRQEIERLPVHNVEHIDEYDLIPEAKLLIGWWMNKATTRPAKSPSAWMRSRLRPKSHWGPEIRQRIAEQVEFIRGWEVICGDYTAAPDVAATWFIDPPYSDKDGRHYEHTLDAGEYTALAKWASSRSGEVIVCEQAGATWMPFSPFVAAKASNSTGTPRTTMEVAWRIIND